MYYSDLISTWTYVHQNYWRKLSLKYILQRLKFGTHLYLNCAFTTRMQSQYQIFIITLVGRYTWTHVYLRMWYKSSLIRKLKISHQGGKFWRSHSQAQSGGSKMRTIWSLQAHSSRILVSPTRLPSNWKSPLSKKRN